MCSLTLSSLYTNDLLKFKNRAIKQTCFQRGSEFIKKDIIYKEKSGTAQR